MDGQIVTYVGNKQLKMSPLMESESPILHEKEILAWKEKQKYIPSKTHPYKRHFTNQKGRNVI